MFGQCYVMTFALCGHVLVMYMVYHGGKVTTMEVNMEVGSFLKDGTGSMSLTKKVEEPEGSVTL